MKIKSFLISFAMFFGVIFIFTGCTSAPIYNIQNKPIERTHAKQDIGAGIIKAGQSLGWQMKKVEDGVILGKIAIRTHSANIKITYDDTNYNIELQKSKDLNYNKENNTIHKYYNGWIKNLENSIDINLSPYK